MPHPPKRAIHQHQHARQRCGQLYSGLNLRLQMQNLHDTGLSLAGNYTWSHALDELISTFGDSLQGGSGYIVRSDTPRWPIRNLIGGAPIPIYVSALPSPPSGRHRGSSGVHKSNVRLSADGRFPASSRSAARVPFSVFDYSEDGTVYTVPRLEPATPFYSEAVSKKPQVVGPNEFNRLKYSASQRLCSSQQHSGNLRLWAISKRHDAPQLAPRSGSMERRRIASQDLPTHRACGNGILRRRHQCLEPSQFLREHVNP